jgi:hypothetical protein
MLEAARVTASAGPTDAARAREEFERIAARFGDRPGVTSGTGFGSNPGLRIDGRIFAMLSEDALVVKLPAARVHELVAGGDAAHFDAGKGRPMREWASVGATRSGEWEPLVREALEFVGAGPPKRPRR